MKITRLIEYLDQMFVNPDIELHYNSNFQCLVAVILSAQCTDKRVNKVTDKLFAEYPTPQKMGELSQEELEKIIYSTGFYHNKAKNLLNLCHQLVESYNGEIPNSAEELQKLSGVGRKTANVVASALFDEQKIGVDTHVMRVTNRLGLVNADSPLKVEKQWMSKYPEYCNRDMHYKLVLFGRYHCKAVKPNCEQCNLKDECKYYQEKRK